MFRSVLCGLRFFSSQLSVTVVACVCPLHQHPLCRRHCQNMRQSLEDHEHRSSHSVSVAVNVIVDLNRLDRQLFHLCNLWMCSLPGISYGDHVCNIAALCPRAFVSERRFSHSGRLSLLKIPPCQIVASLPPTNWKRLWVIHVLYISDLTKYVSQ
ncbi:hypothetical protein DFJ58DRAFT_774891 [Suillus subalutaceus]|uniref:uncharacterized protein n=1 Tax=Suillus subalutaceus TaxID=48586 RepID=UPI001B86F526|nr:uncharacterized protein DFJ58DRAFT_774891 [Suillus subalutaceus]KAG1862747.1 hypothetical protein DFJ58DRAFT_774891 [Suillus subalutaceus]